MRLRATLAASVVAITAVAACAGPTPTAAPSAAVPSPVTPTSPASTPDAPSPQATVEPAVTTSTAPGSVVRDDSLLAILPPDLDGAMITAEEESFAEAAADPAFAGNVERAAFAIVVAPDNLASGVLAQLAPGVYSDTFFQDWRETYSEGACAQAGGVVGNAEAELDGRTVYITTCDGGLRVYHTWLEERGVLVSLFSLGEGRFGERLMADLRP